MSSNNVWVVEWNTFNYDCEVIMSTKFELFKSLADAKSRAEELKEFHIETNELDPEEYKWLENENKFMSDEILWTIPSEWDEVHGENNGNYYIKLFYKEIN